MLKNLFKDKSKYVFNRQFGFHRVAKFSLTVKIAILAGLLTAGASAYALRQYTINNQELSKALVVSRDIMPYTIITSGDLVWQTVPLGSTQAGTVQNPREVVGRMNTTPLFKGEQVRKEKLTDPGLTIQSTERAVAIPSNIVKSVGGTIKPGDIVDLFWIVNPETPATLISQNARILDIRNKSGSSVSSPGSDGNVVQKAVANTVADNKGEGFVVVVIVNQVNAATVARAAINGDVVISKTGANHLAGSITPAVSETPVSIPQPNASTGRTNNPGQSTDQAGGVNNSQQSKRRPAPENGRNSATPAAATATSNMYSGVN